jgi:hypothetical protein
MSFLMDAYVNENTYLIIWGNTKNEHLSMHNFQLNSKIFRQSSGHLQSGQINYMNKT